MNGKKEESKMGELLAKIVGSLESGERKDSTSSNRNSLPYNFSTDCLNSPPSAGWHMSLPVFPVREQRYLCVTEYVGYSGLNLSELSQTEHKKDIICRRGNGVAFDPGLMCTKSLKLKFGEIFNI